MNAELSRKERKRLAREARKRDREAELWGREHGRNGALTSITNKARYCINYDSNFMMLHSEAVFLHENIPIGVLVSCGAEDVVRTGLQSTTLIVSRDGAFRIYSALAAAGLVGNEAVR